MLQNFCRQKDDMSNKDQTELGATGQNFFARDFCALRVLAYMKKLSRSWKKKEVQLTPTPGRLVKSSLVQAQKLPSA